MYLTVHATAGLLVARAFPHHPLLAFLGGLASHFVLDMVPHGDELPPHLSRPQAVRRLLGAATLDGAVLIGWLLLYLRVTPLLPTSAVAAAVIGSVLPDALEGIDMLTHTTLLRWFSRFHERVHNFTKLKLRWPVGMLLQCLTLTALWLLVIS